MCGGTTILLYMALEGAGLSPRVRGNLAFLALVGIAPRSIPACAGEPGTIQWMCGAPWVYPRVCGGTSLALTYCSLRGGLSPRVRGNLDGLTPIVAYVRSIPACAGEPLLIPASLALLTVYPRVCGGTGGVLDVTKLKYGLSPRVRGNPGMGVAGMDKSGSIPACAGEPLATVMPPSHPISPSYT